jgi:hypothetical protein
MRMLRYSVDEENVWFFMTGINIIFVSIYIPLFSIQSTIKNYFPLAKR